MRSVAIAVVLPCQNPLAGMGQRGAHRLFEERIPKAPLKLPAKPFGMGVPGAIERRSVPVCRHKLGTAIDVSSVPLPETTTAGRPPCMISASNSRMTQSLERGVVHQRTFEWSTARIRARSTRAHLADCHDMRHTFPLQAEHYHFGKATSGRIVFPIMASPRTFFRLAFQSSSALSHRTSETSDPPSRDLRLRNNTAMTRACGRHRPSTSRLSAPPESR